MNEFGKALVIIGVVLTLVGAILWTGVGKNWIGRLPGDISIRKENFSFYFPLTTCLLVSVILTLLFRIFRK